MKIRASSFLKDIFSVVMHMVKAKSMAVKSKTSSLKTRLLVLVLLQNKKVLMKASSHKIHAHIGNQDKGGMKIRVSSFLKNIFSDVMLMVMAKSMAVKSKTSSLKTRLLVLGLLQNKKVLMKAISHKIHAIIGNQDKGEGDAKDLDKAVVLYNAAKSEALLCPTCYIEPSGNYTVDDDDNDGYPDLRYSLFDLEDVEEDDDDYGNATESVIDLVRSSKEDGAEFSLEDEIDHVADV